MFNSLSKRFKGDQPPPKPKDSETIEGFICPMCMESFPAPDLVQKHFDAAHNDSDTKADNKVKNSVLSPSTERKESIQNIQDNFKDLKQSLDEEMWYNKELQKEVERLNKSLLDKEAESNAAISSNRTQLEELKKSHDILTVELKKTQISRDSLLGENKTIRSDFHICEKKISDMIVNEKKLQKIIDQQKLDHETLKEQLISLNASNESQNLRSSELSEMQEKYETSVNVNKDLKSEIEKIKNDHEQERMEWNVKHSTLTETSNKMELEKSSLINEHAELVSKLHSQIESGQFENQRLNEILKSNEDKILKMNSSWNADQTTLENTLVKLNENDAERQKLKLQTQEMTNKVKSREAELMQLKNELSNKEDEMRNCQRLNKSIQEELENVKHLLESVKDEKILLQSQVEMGDAANVVMEQFQSEKKLLQENILSLKKQIEKETEEKDVEFSTLKAELQTYREQIFNLNSSISEKDEQLDEITKKNKENLNDFEKVMNKLELEISAKSQLEEKIMLIERDQKSKEESLYLFHANYNSLKDEFDKSQRKNELDEEKFKVQLTELYDQLNIAKIDSNKVILLEKEIQMNESKNQSLECELNNKTSELDSLRVTYKDLLEVKENMHKEIESKSAQIITMQTNIDDQQLKISSLSDDLVKDKSNIKQLTEQTVKDANALSDQAAELSLANGKITELEDEIEQSKNKISLLNKSIEEFECEMKKLLDDNAVLKIEIDLIKKNLLEKEESMKCIEENKEIVENKLSEIQNNLLKLEENYENVKIERDETTNELLLCKSQIDSVQELYSDSVKLQNEYHQKLNVTTSEFNNTKKCLSELEELYNSAKSEHSKVEDYWKKEEIQQKNKISALTKTLNESSENYKQERLETAEKEYSLISRCDELKNNLENTKKSLHRIEEDLETEKNLRESERNNMMEKISQLSEQIVVLENMRNDYEQKMEVIETDNIENKLRLEVANEEKEKLLEKIIQVENNLKKQTELYSKKCREFDQLQSAILDLGRENQSLQISKEKLTNRQWIGDFEAVECYTCHKPFSLTLRKHHCRNCGQVYCQDCSSKSASLAVARKPVRVCDSCYMEVQSHRRNSSVTSSNMSLQI